MSTPLQYVHIVSSNHTKYAFEIKYGSYGIPNTAYTMLHLSLEVSQRRCAVCGTYDAKCIGSQCETIMNVYSFYYNHTVFAVAAVACLLIVQTTLCPFEEIASPVRGQFKLDNRGNLGMLASNLEILRTNTDILVICTIQTHDPRANSADVDQGL